MLFILGKTSSILHNFSNSGSKNEVAIVLNLQLRSCLSIKILYVQQQGTWLQGPDICFIKTFIIYLQNNKTYGLEGKIPNLNLL